MTTGEICDLVNGIRNPVGQTYCCSICIRKHLHHHMFKTSLTVSSCVVVCHFLHDYDENVTTSKIGKREYCGVNCNNMPGKGIRRSNCHHPYLSPGHVVCSLDRIYICCNFRSVGIKIRHKAN